MRYLAIILLLIVFTNCRKQGCTDQQASNYDWKAKKEDGSCIFSGKISFWSPYQNQYNIYIWVKDDLYPDKYTWEKLWTYNYNPGTTGPECGSPEYTAIFNRDPGTYHYYAIMGGDTLWTGYVTTTEKTCQKIKLN